MLGQFLKRSAPIVVDEARASVPWSSFFQRFGFDGNSYSTPFAGLDQLNELQASQNSIVAACVSVRGLVFSEARFKWQAWSDDGRPGQMYGTEALELLERPWQSGTTGDLLARMELDYSVYGNSYWVKRGGELRRLDPSKVLIVSGDDFDRPSGRMVGRRLLGYLVAEHTVSQWSDDTPVDTDDGVFFLPDEVAHYKPTLSPHHEFRGQSWISTILPDSLADSELTQYKHAFLRNAATPNMAVVFPKEWDVEDIERFKSAMDSKHAGVDKAFKTLYIGGGADVRMLGADFHQLNMKTVQGGGETRVAVAAGVPAAILGISEGLGGSALNQGNYTAARRRFADGTLRPLWRAACAALETLLVAPGGSRLWFDERDISFLQEDVLDAAEINSKNSSTIRSLVDGGFEPQSVIDAVATGDMSRLRHSGNVSVQLRPVDATGTPTMTPQQALED